LSEEDEDALAEGKLMDWSVDLMRS
jgi:hypothetical protein